MLAFLKTKKQTNIRNRSICAFIISFCIPSDDVRLLIKSALGKFQKEISNKYFLQCPPSNKVRIKKENVHISDIHYLKPGGNIENDNVDALEKVEKLTFN